MFYILIWMVVTQMYTYGNIYWIFHRRFICLTIHIYIYMCIYTHTHIEIIYIHTHIQYNIYIHTYNASIKKLKNKTLQLDNQITGTL